MVAHRDDDPRRPASRPPENRQPADPADLAAFPPATPGCLRIRHLLRDYVDGDLEAGEVAEVDAHVHECRSCGLALARTESEDLQLRRAFADVDGGTGPAPGFTASVLAQIQPELEGAPPGPEPGFTARVMAGVWTEVEASRVERGAAARVETPRPTRRSVWRTRRLWAAAAALLVTALAVYGATRPTWSPAEVLVARGVASAEGELRPGALPARAVQLTVGAGGELSMRLAGEPGARPMVRAGADTEIQTDGSDLLLVGGDVDFDVPETLGVRVGSAGAVRLASGRYEFSAIPVRHQDSRVGTRVQVTVRAGKAEIERDGEVVEVQPEQTATWSTFASINIDDTPDADLFAASRQRGADEPRRTRPAAPDARPVFGQLFDALTSLPVGEATVSLRTVLGIQTVATEPDGRFRFELEGLEGGFGVLSVTPGGTHAALAAMRPTPLRLDRGPMRRFFLRPAHGLRGRLADQQGRGVARAFVQPCRVDEVFGLVEPLAPAVRADGVGNFEILGLDLSNQPQPHESLVVLAWRQGERPHIVLARTQARPVDGTLELRLPSVPQKTLVGAVPNHDYSLLLPIDGLPPEYAAQVVTARSDADGRLQVEGGGLVYLLENGGETRLLDTTKDGGTFRLLEAVGLPQRWRLPEPEHLDSDGLHWLAGRSRFDGIAALPAPGTGGLISVHDDMSGQVGLGSQVFLRDAAGLWFLGIFDGRGPLWCAPETTGELIAFSPEGWVGRSYLAGPLGRQQLSLAIQRSAQFDAVPGDGQSVVWAFRRNGGERIPVIRPTGEPITVLSGNYEVPRAAAGSVSVRLTPGERQGLPR